MLLRSLVCLVCLVWFAGCSVGRQGEVDTAQAVAIGFGEGALPVRSNLVAGVHAEQKKTHFAEPIWLVVETLDPTIQNMSIAPASHGFFDRTAVEVLEGMSVEDFEKQVWKEMVAADFSKISDMAFDRAVFSRLHQDQSADTESTYDELALLVSKRASGGAGEEAHLFVSDALATNFFVYAGPWTNAWSVRAFVHSPSGEVLSGGHWFVVPEKAMSPEDAILKVVPVADLKAVGFK